MTSLLHLAWPILRVNDKNVQRFDSARDLVVESEYVLARGAYEARTSLIDARGRQFDVLAVRKLRPSYSWKYWGAKHRAWVIDLDLKLLQIMSLEDVKKMLLSIIAEHRWHLLERLTASLGADPDIQESWIEEAQRREKQVADDTVGFVAGDEAVVRLRNSLR